MPEAAQPEPRPATRHDEPFKRVADSRAERHEPEHTTPAGANRRPTMFVVVGLPATGKTSRARELASAWSALRLTPDEWMIPLFGQEQPKASATSWRVGAIRDANSSQCRARLWRVGQGRSAPRVLAASVGATSELVYLQVDEEEQWRRVQARSETDAATTVEMTKSDLERRRQTFQPAQDSDRA